MIGRHNYLTLHKSEWDRLKRKPTLETRCHKREQYINGLNEQSQKWIKLWPDAVQEHVSQVKKQKEIKHEKLILTVKEFSTRRKQDHTTEAVKKAKELIFADSCYGRQLLSALLESKTLEERDLQIKFKDELMAIKNSTKHDEPPSLSLFDSKHMEIEETKNKLRKGEMAKEAAIYNAALIEMQKEKERKEKEQKKLELIDVKLNQEFMKRDAEIKVKVAYMEKEAIKQHEAENAKIKDYNLKREEQDELERQIWRKYQDRIRAKEKAVFNKLHHEKYDSPQCQKVFKMIQDSEDNKNHKYDKFIQKGIERWLDRSNKRKQKEIDIKISQRDKRKLLDEENKIQSEFQNHKHMQEIDKSVCCRQCILPKCSNATKEKAAPKKKDPPDISAFRIPEFLLPSKKHIDDLKARQLKPTPWNALKSSHEEFSRRAGNVLQECRYKNAARKVVDDYRRINCLDSKSLPVSNYN